MSDTTPSGVTTPPGTSAPIGSSAISGFNPVEGPVQPSVTAPNTISTPAKPVGTPVNSTPTNQAPPQAQTPPADGNTVPNEGQGMDPNSFESLLSNINATMSTNNNLTASKQLLVKGLYDSPLTPSEIAQLPKDIQDVYNSGDKNAMELQIRVLNDQIQGRANTLGQSIQALTTGYTQSVTNTKNAMTEILNYAQSTGQPIASVAKALAPIYGLHVTTNMLATLQALGAPLLKTTQVQGSNTGVYGPATSTISGIIGVVPTTPLSDVITGQGMDSIVNAIIQNEGASLSGVQNNPGNIKYDPTNLQPGETDSGVKASDGGTFASFDSNDDGRSAIASIVTAAADSNSPAYGVNPTLGSFIDKYTNTSPDASVSPAPPDPTTGDVPDPKLGGYSPNLVYQDALDYALTGKSIQSYVGGLSNSGNSAAAKQAIGNKAAAIATAMGSTFPAIQALYKANASAAKQNVERLARVESVNNSVTLNFPRIEALADKVKADGINITESDVQAGAAATLRKFGNVDASNYIELIQTVRSDYAAAQAALAGSRGGQFFANAANTAIPIGLTSDQYEGIKNTIILSSTNAQTAINQEVNNLLGTSGSSSTGSSSSTTQPSTDNSDDNSDSDYQSYLSTIGQ